MLFTNLEFFDNLIYNLLGDTLKNTLDVNSNSLTVKGILADYVVVALESVDSAIATAIRENVQYLVALVDMLYKLVVFIICFVLYLILRAILYVCYVLFYPNWRYKIKRNKKFAENSKYKPYKSRRLAGGLIGFCCSLVSAIIGFSFLGNVMYMFAGTGEKGLPAHDFGDAQTNQAYNILNSVESYGDNGIFKLLNLPKTSDGTPLYLYIGGLVLSGDLENPATGEVEKVYFTQEIGNYVTFIKECGSLLIEYGAINDLMEDTVEPDSFMTLLNDKAFQVEFRSVLESHVNKSTFIGDFLFSVVDTYAANINNSEIFAESFDDDVKDITNILFTKGYKSSVIPFEIEYTGNQDLPYIKASDIFSKKDLLVVYDVFTELINAGIMEEDCDVIDAVLSVTHYLEDLKVFSKNNKNKDSINGVLGRLYSFVERKVLDENYVTAVDRYSENLDVDWTDEIVALVDTASDINKIYRKIDEVSKSENNDIMSYVEGVFDNEELVDAYDEILDFVSNSKMGARLISTNKVYKEIEKAMSEAFAYSYYPENINYVNYVNNAGVVVHGELFNFLTVIKNLALDMDARELLRTIVEEKAEDIDFVTLFNDAKGALTHKDIYNKNVIDYIEESILLRAFSSAAILSMAFEDETVIYVPDIAKEKDKYGNTLNLIKHNEFSLIMDSLFSTADKDDPTTYGIFDLIPDDVDLESDTLFEDILDANGNLFENKVIYKLISESYIIQATAGKWLSDNRNGEIGETLKFPDSLSTPENWLVEYHVVDGNIVVKKQSELVKLFDATHELFETTDKFKDIDNAFDNLLSDETLNKLNYPATKISSIISDDGISVEQPLKSQVLYNSQIIKHTISDLIIDSLPSDIPQKGIDEALENGIIKYNEFAALIDVIDFLDIKDLNDEDSFSVDDYFDAIGNVITVESYGYNDEKSGSLLDLSYNSSIIKYYFSDVVDDGLVDAIGSDDDNVESLSFFKQNDCYKKEDVSGLIKSLLVLDVVDLDNATDDAMAMFPYFNEQISSEDYPLSIDKNQDGTHNSIVRLNVLYNSELFKLLIADSVEEQIQSNEFLQDHPEAYDVNYTDYKVYKYSEISSLSSLLESFTSDDSQDGNSFENINKDSFNLNDFKENYYDKEKAQFTSKLLVSSISLNVINESEGGVLIIPEEAALVIPNYEILKDVELYNLLSFAVDLGFDTVGKVNNMDDNEKLSISVINEYVDKNDAEIIRATVSDKFIESNTSGDMLTIPGDVVGSTTDIKGNSFRNLLRNELSAIFNILTNEIHLETVAGIEDININTFNLNSLYDHEEGGNLVDGWISESRIIYATVSKKVIDTKDSSDNNILTIPNNQAELIEDIDSNSCKLIIKSELNVLFDFLVNGVGKTTVGDVELIDVNDFNLKSLHDHTESGQFVNGWISKSEIIYATVSGKIIDTKDSSDNNVLSIPKDRTQEIEDINSNSCKLIIKTELNSLLDFLTSGIGITSVGDVENVKVDDFNLQSLYDHEESGSFVDGWISKSRIIHATVSDKIIETKDSSDNDVFSIPKNSVEITEDVNSSVCKILLKSELNSLLDILTNGIGVGNVGDVEDVKVDDFNLISLYDHTESGLFVEGWISRSQILHATISTKIIETSDEADDYLIVPLLARLNDGQGNYDEITQIVSNVISITDATMKVISVQELTYFFTALNSININNIANAKALTESNFDPTQYNDTQIENLAGSSILRATITQNVKFIGEGVEVAAKALDFEVDHGNNFVSVKEITDNKIAILHDHEIVHLLKAIKEFKGSDSTGDSAFTCRFDISKIKQLNSSGSLDIILESDIFRVAISDVIIEPLTVAGIYFETVNPQPLMYCFALKNAGYFDVLDKAEIKRCVDIIPG
ncbi:MAG: hypothetical protein IKB98_02775 [Clostridia bacterium]|nr:hypothetical protein [Clostridia bacterium]